MRDVERGLSAAGQAAQHRVPTWCTTAMTRPSPGRRRGASGKATASLRQSLMDGGTPGGCGSSTGRADGAGPFALCGNLSRAGYGASVVPRASQTPVCLPVIDMIFPSASKTILPFVARTPSSVKIVPLLPRTIV